MRINKTGNFNPIFSLSNFLFLAFLVFGLQSLSAQSSNLKPNIAPDEFTAKSGNTGWQEGKTVPNLKFNDINGKKSELYSLLEKPVIFEFYTLDCKACTANKKYLKAFFKQFNINIVGICTDEYPNQIRKMTREQGLHWANIYDDSKKFSGKTFAKGSGLGDPAFVLILPDKTVSKIYNSPADVKKLGVDLQMYFSNN